MAHCSQAEVGAASQRSQAAWVDEADLQELQEVQRNASQEEEEVAGGFQVDREDQVDEAEVEEAVASHMIPHLDRNRERRGKSQHRERQEGDSQRQDMRQRGCHSFQQSIGPLEHFSLVGTFYTQPSSTGSARS